MSISLMAFFGGGGFLATSSCFLCNCLVLSLFVFSGKREIKKLSKKTDLNNRQTVCSH